MDKTIKEIRAVKKSQERIYFEDSSKVLRCYGIHNPHYYEDETGKLNPINIGHLEEKITGVGKSHLRSKNVVSVGFRDDANPEKYLGLRLDVNQKEGNEQLEFSIEKIEDMCSHDTIMTPEEAIKLGLADKIIEDMLK